MNKIFFAKTKENAIIPTKHLEDAGYDFYAYFKEDNITINPGEIKLIPTGIATAFSSNYVLFIKERGSTGSRAMATRMGVIDSGFRGEIIIGINNTGTKPVIIAKKPELFNEEAFIIYPYTKAIAQGILLQSPNITSQEISFEELQKIESLRGDGLLGSSGK